MLTEDQYHLALRQSIDGLNARADLPQYEYASDEQTQAIAYFLARGVQIGEAAFRTRDLPVPLEISIRVLCDDLIRLVWVSQSESNASEFARATLSEMAKMTRLATERGFGQIIDKTTRRNVTPQVVATLSAYEVKGKKSIEQVALECGLEKLYTTAFRFGSLPMHGNTFGVLKTSADALVTLPAITAFLRAEAQIADDYPNRITTADEIMRILGGNAGRN